MAAIALMNENRLRRWIKKIVYDLTYSKLYKACLFSCIFDALTSEYAHRRDCISQG